MLQAFFKAMKSDTTEEEYYQHQVRECGSYIHNLKIKWKQVYELNLYFTSFKYWHNMSCIKRKGGLWQFKKKLWGTFSAFNYYEGIYWFCANTFENKMLQYFTETSESHIGYFQLWSHILRHLRHLLALCWKSHKPPFCLAQLIYIFTCKWNRQRTEGYSKGKSLKNYVRFGKNGLNN